MREMEKREVKVEVAAVDSPINYIAANTKTSPTFVNSNKNFQGTKASSKMCGRCSSPNHTTEAENCFPLGKDCRKCGGARGILPTWLMVEGEVGWLLLPNHSSRQMWVL